METSRKLSEINSDTNTPLNTVVQPDAAESTSVVGGSTSKSHSACDVQRLHEVGDINKNTDLVAAVEHSNSASKVVPANQTGDDDFDCESAITFFAVPSTRLNTKHVAAPVVTDDAQPDVKVAASVETDSKEVTTSTESVKTDLGEETTSSLSVNPRKEVEGKSFPRSLDEIQDRLELDNYKSVVGAISMLTCLINIICY